jgi:ketosteroid isomerase-like protein
LFSVIVSLSPKTAPAQTAQATPDVDTGVQTFLADWVTAWNAHDANAVMRLHAED